MAEYLILKLQGPMQAWGGHTYEDYRPSELFPTRSGLLGLLAACLGIDRRDHARQQSLSKSFQFAVRADCKPDIPTRKMTDFHTVMDARKVDGKARKFPVVSRREYLCDASFTVAMDFQKNAEFDLQTVQQALTQPHYTPFLGRRSCPLARPIFESVVEADTAHEALASATPHAGTVYSEWQDGDVTRLRVRDVPTFAEHRQFQTRDVFICNQESTHVPQ